MFSYLLHPCLPVDNYSLGWLQVTFMLKVWMNGRKSETVGCESSLIVLRPNFYVCPKNMLC